MAAADRDVGRPCGPRPRTAWDEGRAGATGRRGPGALWCPEWRPAGAGEGRTLWDTVTSER